MTIDKKPFNIALFASGSGTNVENISAFFHCHPSIHIDSVFYNRKQAYVAKRAEILGLEAIYLPDSSLKNESFFLKELKSRNISHLILAGFLSKIPSCIVDEYRNRIINIHPALLPKYGGQGMYGHHVHQAVKDNKEEESGITIHIVNEYYDKGDILFQARCRVSPKDNAEDIALNVHKLEYEYYPTIIEKWILNTL